MATRPSSGGSTLERALHALEKMEAKLAAAERAKFAPIAIIGMGCRFPGGASNPASFWHALRAGVHAIIEVPAARWGVSRTAPQPAAHWAGLLEGIDQFDGQFFGLGRHEAADMDPQQRLLLEVAWETVENAGVVPSRLTGTKTGVFVGISSREYSDLVAGSTTEPRPYVITGNASSFAASRIAYHLGLRGPSMSVDTACSSSLVALHLACQSLRRGECDMALVGGVNLILSPETSNLLASLQILSPDGRCRTFDAHANGYVRAEGAGFILIERLSDAHRHDDQIHAIIRGSAANQNGRAMSLTAPNGQAQADVIRAALQDARVAADQIGYVEVHSNGSPLGDSVELEALRQVLGQPRKDGSHCVLGSVKSCIGHAEAASGMASLIKAVLVLSHDTIPRNLNFESLTPHANISDTSLVIPVAEMAWKRTNVPRFVGVSATGLSGTNAHVVLEEPPITHRAQDKIERPFHLFVLSGKTSNALRDQAKQSLRHLAAHAELPLGDQCHTLGAGRMHFDHRFAAVVATSADATGQLSDYLDGVASAYLTGHVENISARRRIAFVFTGRGAQVRAILGAVRAVPPALRDALRHADDAVHALVGRRVAHLLEAENSDASPQASIDEDIALFLLQYALVELWRSWGFEPSVVAGDGIGECVAAWAAGALDLSSALGLAMTLARFEQSQGREHEQLSRELSRIAVKAPRHTFLPSLGDASSSASLGTKTYWTQRFATTTDWERIISRISSLGCDACLEIGPSPTKMGRSTEGRNALHVFPSLRPRVPVYRALLESLAGLYIRGFSIRWEGLDGPHPYRRIAMPTYPFQRQRHWFGKANVSTTERVVAHEHPLLGRALEARADKPDVRTWENILDDTSRRAIGEQCISTVSLLASGGIVEMAGMAARESLGNTPWEMNLALGDPPAFDDATSATVQIIATPQADSKVSIGIFFRPRSGAPWKRVANGTAEPVVAPTDDEDIAPPSMRPGRRQSVPSAWWENRLELFGLDAEAFRIEQLWRRDGETLAHVSLANPRAASAFARAAIAISSISHPAAYGRWWMIEAVEGFAMKSAAPVGRLWLRLNWLANDGYRARMSAEFVDEEGTLTASVRRIDLRAQDPASALHAAGKDSLEDAMFDFVWKEKPPSTTQQAARRRWLILADAGGIGAALTSHLQAANQTVVTFPAADIEKHVDKLDLVLGVSGPFHGVVYLGALDGVTNDQTPVSTLDDILTHEATTTLSIIDRLAAQVYVPRLWFVTRGAQCIGETAPAIARAALWGSWRVLSLERPDMRGGLIDLDPADDDAEAARLAQALVTFGVDDHMAFRAGKTHVARLARIPIPHQQPLAIRPDRTYVITGAKSPFGSEVARWLADRGARKLLLVEMDSPEDGASDVQGASDALANLTRTLDAQGVAVFVSRVNFADVSAIERIVSEANPPIGGFIDAAGTMDQNIHHLATADATAIFQKAMRAKLLPMWAFHLATLRHPVDFFVTFSSITSALGWDGVGADAFASAFADAVIRMRHRIGLPGTAVHIAFPNEVRPGRTDLENQLLAAGFQAMPAALSLEAMERLVVYRHSVATAAWVDWDLFDLARGNSTGRSLVEGLVGGRNVRTGPAAMQRRIVGAPPEQARHFVENVIRGEIARVLGTDPDDIIAHDRELASLGMDSIMSVQVLTGITGALGVNIPTNALLENPTIESLSRRVVATLRRDRRIADEDAVMGPVSRRGLLVEFNREGAKPPLFFAPPIMGSALIFQSLVQHISKDQPFFSFNAPGVDTDVPPCDRIPVLAARFVDEMRKAQSKGPYLLGGYSFGALVAFEMAHVLSRAGEVVGALILGDIPPLGQRHDGTSPLAIMARLFDLPIEEMGFDSLAPAEQASQMAQAMGELLMLPSSVGESAAQLGVYRAHLSAMQVYVPEPYSGPVTLICTRMTAQAVASSGLITDDPTLGWQALCTRPVRVCDVPGNHFNAIVAPAVTEFARVLQDALGG